jgi:hypothetical protein
MKKPKIIYTPNSINLKEAKKAKIKENIKIFFGVLLAGLMFYIFLWACYLIAPESWIY